MAAAAGGGGRPPAPPGQRQSSRNQENLINKAAEAAGSVKKADDSDVFAIITADKQVKGSDKHAWSASRVGDQLLQ